MAYLVLSSGEIFEGKRFGAAGECTGELVFTTNVVGYLETLSDPAFTGQIVMQTFPLIGNYGTIEEDLESGSAPAGYVVREICESPSNFRTEYGLDTYLKNKGVCGICGIDTRELTRVIRDNGVVNAMICDEVPEDISVIARHTVCGAVESVSHKKAEVYPTEGEKKYSVTVIDYGMKKSLAKALCARGCEVTAVPCGTSAEEVLAAKPDGVVLSGGPGDPAENGALIREIGGLIGKVPVLGIGLGHQMAAIAMGGKTEKLKYGHRGGNQPVRDLKGVRTYMTNQNHGYTVAETTGEVVYANASDDTCEGIEYPGKRCFTVQFEPDAGNSFCGTGFVYDKFIEMMGGDGNA